MAPQSPWLACNNEDTTFNNLDRQIKRGFNSYSSPWALHRKATILQCPSSLPLSSAPVNHMVAWQNGLCSSGGAATVFSLILWLRVTEVQKHQEEPCCRIEGLTHTQTEGFMMFLWRGPLALPPSCIPWLCPPQVNAPDWSSLTWVALSILLNTCISMPSEEVQTPPIRNLFRLRLRSLSLSFHCGFTWSL